MNDSRYARLTCTTDNHWKEYEVYLESVGGDLFKVYVKWGKIGSLLNTTPKSGDIPYSAASVLFDDIVRKQLNNRDSKYDLDPPKAKKVATTDVARVINPPTKTKVDTGFRPQLVTHLDVERGFERRDAAPFLDNPKWFMTKKYDGERCAIYISPVEIYGTNRKGQKVDLPEPIRMDARKLLKPSIPYLVPDGEMCPGIYWVFDLFAVNGKETSQIYRDRMDLMESLKPQPTVRIARVARTREEKYAYFDELSPTAEGVVFTHVDSLYTPGVSPNRVAIKFWYDISCVVIGYNVGKESIRVGLRDGNEIRDVGSVTTIGKDKQEIGGICKCRYLYYVSSLYQPEYLHRENDRDKPDSVSEVHLKEGMVAAIESDLNELQVRRALRRI